MSGGLHAWITSTPSRAGRAEDETSGPHPAVRELPDVRDRPRGRRRRRVFRMRMPSSSWYAGSPGPFGQMIDTWNPASRSALASSQTRRSNGTGRFWTMMRTRRSGSANPSAFLTRRAPRSRGVPRSPLRAGPGASSTRAGGAASNAPSAAASACPRSRPRRRRRFLRGRAEHLAKVRQPALDVAEVRADEALGIDDGVVDAKSHALAEQRLRHLDERALAEVVGLRLEAEAEQRDALAPVSSTRCTASPTCESLLRGSRRASAGRRRGRARRA